MQKHTELKRKNLIQINILQKKVQQKDIIKKFMILMVRWFCQKDALAQIPKVKKHMPKRRKILKKKQQNIMIVVLIEKKSQENMKDKVSIIKCF